MAGPSDTRPVPPPERPPEPDRPMLNDRYSIVRELGEKGGMARVYLAKDTEARQQVVVKIPRSDLIGAIGQDMQLLKRFESEFGAQAELEHKHIVRIRGKGRAQVGDSVLPFFVVDFKGGGDLSDRLAGKPQPLSEVLEWARPIAEALDFSHQRGWVHRDVKPDNILFDAQSDVYLSDFGIAKTIRSGETTLQVGVDATPKTTMGAAIGTRGYMPPEALTGEPTGAYDQYGLGVVIASALTGVGPNQDVGPGVNAELIAASPWSQRSAIRRALADNPGNRYETCTALVDALAGLQGGWWPARSGLAALLAALVVAIGFLAWERKTPPVPSPAPEAMLGSTIDEVRAAIDLCRSHASDPEADCDLKWYADESPPRPQPQRGVELDPNEVTVGDFRVFIAAEEDRSTEVEDRNKTFIDVGGRLMEVSNVNWREPGWQVSDDQPVVHVTRNDAEAYCSWLGKRLPTEDEWEAVARGTEASIFPWGDDWDSNGARWRADSPSPVGQFSPTPSGHFDLAGNVWEWTTSRIGDKAVVKGGSWADWNPANLRAATRHRVALDHASDDVGFRCARDFVSQ